MSGLGGRRNRHFGKTFADQDFARAKGYRGTTTEPEEDGQPPITGTETATFNVNAIGPAADQALAEGMRFIASWVNVSRSQSDPENKFDYQWSQDFYLGEPVTMNIGQNLDAGDTFGLIISIDFGDVTWRPGGYQLLQFENTIHKSREQLIYEFVPGTNYDVNIDATFIMTPDYNPTGSITVDYVLEGTAAAEFADYEMSFAIADWLSSEHETEDVSEFTAGFKLLPGESVKLEGVPTGVDATALANNPIGQIQANPTVYEFTLEPLASNGAYVLDGEDVAVTAKVTIDYL